MPNLNETPKIIDFENTLFAGQQANESGSRHLTGTELAEKLKRDLTINGQRIASVPAGALPAGPTGQTRYMEVTAVGTWTYGGVDIGSNADGYKTTFWWDGTTWSNNGSVKVQGDPAPADGVVEEGNTQAVSGGEVYDKLYNPSVDYLHIFQDSNGAVVAYIDINGKFVFDIGEEQREYIVGDVFENISDTQKNEINNVKVIDHPDYLYLLVDAENKVIFSIDKDGLVDAKFKSISQGGSNLSNLFTESYPTDLSYQYEITSQVIISSGISLPTTAVGKESSVGANDAPTIPLTDRGLAHPSVVYHPSGWNGWKYWMAFTPYFPPTVGSEYENPHIMVSNDGITWQEPLGITNPIDLPQALPNNGYWSDTHLKIGDDGFMHVWYRGNYMDFEGIPYTRFVVHRKSRDGVNWSDATLCYSTSDPELSADNQIVSPAFIKEGSYWHVYDVIVKSQTGGISPVGNSTNNQTNKFISRRISFLPEKDYEPYSLNKIINFKNRPWGLANDTWHLDAQKFGNTTFLLLSVGASEGSLSDTLWLAYSGDGWNFTVFETPLMASLNYRSCMVFKESTDDTIKLDVYAGNTQGIIQLQSLTIKQI